MTLTFVLTRPVACNHWHLQVTLPGGATRRYVFDRDDLALDPEDVDVAIKTLVRHIVKEAGANNFAQAKAALEAETWEV